MNNNLFVLPVAVVIALSFTCISCNKLPEKSDYYGNYRLIKIRENGTILNIDTLARIELTGELYTTAIDRDGDYILADDEIASVSYSFHVSDENVPYLLINNDESPVFLLRQEHFDLILKKIDPLGNETVMYLKE